jgi:alkanesulfonate monooxygenase SsuD/methylene tetrahydromethanopterin reductase-like flavin-dependent oxidoreductase (luciferase family)
MKVDTVLPPDAPLDTRLAAAAAQRGGYAALWTGETNHDPFLALGLAAVGSDTVELGTGIALAFARNPMSTAVQANDLQLLSRADLRMAAPAR